MSNKQNDLFTTGEFAKIAGVTLRTLRYYDTIGLLEPTFRTDSGKRLYNRNDFARLQKILTLKFIGLNLEDISNIMKYDLCEGNFKNSLEIQKKIMVEKVHHISLVIDAIDETLDMLENNKSINWDKFINIISLINIDNRWMEQYENASNLRSRIRIHESFSVNKYGWMQWYFDQLNIPKNAKILDIGCGDGSFWAKNINRVPDEWDITLADFSPGMLKDAKNTLKPYKRKFKYHIADVQAIPFEDSTFDVVIANHMLYHVQDLDTALCEIYRVLNIGGQFYASTVGKSHMAEMREIAAKFDPDIITTKSFNITEKFQLENGFAILKKYFKDIQMERYNDHLIVTEAGPLIDYFFSVPGNVRESFGQDKLKELLEFVQNEINKTGGIYINKDTGFFSSRK